MKRMTLMTVVLALGPGLFAESWPQFRGPGGRAVQDGHKLPTQIAPDKCVVWKTPVPPGFSSPIVEGNRVYLTAVDNKKVLLTLALDRRTGKELWRAEAPYQALEKIQKASSHAQATPATDGEHVVSFFGTAGLFCYDVRGRELWRKAMSPPRTEFGAAASPLIVDGRVILNQDYESGSSLTVFDVRTGKELHRLDRSEFRVGQASPVIWEVAGQKQIVQVGTLRVVGYDFEKLREVWTVRGLAKMPCTTPTIGPDNTLYVAAWSTGSDPEERIEVAPFQELIDKHDANKNGTMEKGEAPEGWLKWRYPFFDRDNDGHVTQAEYEGTRVIFQKAVNRMVAIRPGGRGDVTKAHVRWEQTRQLPYVPSPLYYRAHLYLVRNGGFLNVLDAETGKSLKHDRIRGASDYYASPVGGDGKVYLVSERGELTVVSAGATWEVVHAARFNEDVHATPALVDGRIYLRTSGSLYCFGSPEK